MNNTTRLQKIHDLAHAVLVVVASVIGSVQLVCESLHRLGVNTAGADWRLVTIAGGVGIASQFINSRWSIASLTTGGLSQLATQFLEQFQQTMASGQTSSRSTASAQPTGAVAPAPSVLLPPAPPAAGVGTDAPVT